MDYKVFYRKYRPKNFNELIGQENIKEVLSNSIKLNKIAHAYIFTGPRGTGKTSTAKIFAKTLNCLHNENGISCDNCDRCKEYNESADIIEIDAASNNGVEEIRMLRDSVKIAPYNSKYKVYIIDEVHMLSNSAWNAFLKTLEEPPSHVIFILATTEINKIPDTVMSRCQRFDFSKIPNDLMQNHLKTIAEKENVTIEDDALQEIVKLSDGCLRDALGYLDQVSKLNENVDSKLVESCFGVLTKSKMDDLFTYLLQNDKKAIDKTIDEINKSGVTPFNFINNFIEYLLDKIINEMKYVDKIRELINRLNNITIQSNQIVNPFTLIKVELISFEFNQIISREIISDEKPKEIENPTKEKKVENDNNIEKENETIPEEKTDNVNEQKLKEIRINNSFYNCSKEYKTEFKNKWNEYIETLKNNNEYNLLGYIENANIEVASTNNILFSFNVESESVIFNSKLEDIENSFNTIYKTEYKFIALSINEWKKEKDNFIKNKNKKYEYINEIENIKIEDDKVKNLAQDIFGSDIIEVR